MEINKPISYGIIAVSIGHDYETIRSQFPQLKVHHFTKVHRFSMDDIGRLTSLMDGCSVDRSYMVVVNPVLGVRKIQ
jgi:hypothetical protein